jgi:hypothetical protein
MNYAICLIDNQCEIRLLEFFLLRNDLPEGATVINICISDDHPLDYFFQKRKEVIDGVNIYHCITGSRSNIVILHQVFSNFTNFNHILYSHHDVSNVSYRAYNTINKLLDNPKYTQVGLIGFNILHDSNEINEYSSNLDGLPEGYSTTCRAIFEKGDGYYRKTPGSLVDYSKFEKNKDFLIEIPFWVNCIISKEFFLKYIDINSPFDFHLAFDFIAVSFLKNNIPNICVPYLTFSHQQEVKHLFDMRIKSPFIGKEKNASSFGRKDAHNNWVKYFGFPFNVEKSMLGIRINHNRACKYLGRIACKSLANIDTVAVSNIKSKGESSLSTLQCQFLKHNPSKGPLRYF